MTPIIFQAISWTVIHSLWQVLIIALLAGLLALLSPIRQSAEQRYRGYVAALLLLFFVSVGTFVYEWSSLSGIQINEVFSNNNTLDFETDISISRQIVAPTSSDTFFNHKIENYFNEHLPLIASIWLVGFFIAILRLVGGLGYINYLRTKMNFPVDEYWDEVVNTYATKLKLDKSIAILESALVRSPVVIGHMKPIILFPIGMINRLDIHEVEAILSHELAHIIRNDYLVNVFITVMESLYYFHPGVWWLTSQAKKERENACDDIAIDLLGDKTAYAKSLVVVQEMALTIHHLALGMRGQGSKSELAQRVTRLLPPTERTKMDSRERYTALTVLTAFVMSVAIIVSPSFVGRHSEELDTPDATDQIYLAYQGINGLDSLAVPYCVTDGEYVFDNENYSIKFIVKSNTVSNFSINGVEMAAPDIPAFEGMIRAALSNNLHDEDWQIGSTNRIDNALARALSEIGEDNNQIDLLINNHESIVDGRFLEYDLHQILLKELETQMGRPLTEDEFYVYGPDFNHNNVNSNFQNSTPFSSPPMDCLPPPPAPSVCLPATSPPVPIDEGTYDYHDDGNDNSHDQDFINLFQMKVDNLLLNYNMIDPNNFNYNIGLNEILIDGEIAPKSITKEILRIYKDVYGSSMSPTFSSVRAVVSEASDND